MTPTTNTGNNTGTSTGGTLDCDSAASVLRGMIIQNPAGVCDIAVPLKVFRCRILPQEQVSTTY